MTPRFRSLRLASIAVVLGLAIPAGAQVIPASGASQGPRTGMIVGQVVDSAGAPIPEAIVQMTLPASATPATQGMPATSGRVMTDSEGRFFFSDLPAGDYYLQASSEGYAPGTFGQRSPGGSSQRLPLGQGERRTDVKLRVWKYAVIAGRIVDEAGEPVVGTAVRALIRNIVAGRAVFGAPSSFSVPSVLTDDRGVFRISNLLPGTYVVAAPSMHTTVPVATMSTMDAYAFRTELFWAGVYEVTPLGQPRTQQVGDVALMTLNSVLIPPPPSPAGRLEMYRTTFYPSASTVSAATPITLAAGEDRTNLEITLKPVPAVRISGRLVTPDGSAPPPMTIRLVGESASGVGTPSQPSSTAEVGFETATGMSDASGRFTLLGVPSGEYLLREANSFLMRVVRQGLTAYTVSQPLSVGDRDVTDLIVTVKPALQIEGRIEFRGAAGPQPMPQAAVVGLVLFQSPFLDRRFTGETSRETQTFSSVAAAGQYFVRPYEGNGWYVQSVKAGDTDVTDRLVDLQTNTRLTITYTDRATKVSGTVKDARGAASSIATVLMFPVDRTRWSGYGDSPRNFKSRLASASGVFTFEHVPVGEYFIVAVDGTDADDWQDPQKLEALARRAMTLTVSAADAAKTLDLVVATIR